MLRIGDRGGWGGGIGKVLRGKHMHVCHAPSNMVQDQLTLIGWKMWQACILSGRHRTNPAGARLTDRVLCIWCGSLFGELIMTMLISLAPVHRYSKRGPAISKVGSE